MTEPGQSAEEMIHLKTDCAKASSGHPSAENDEPTRPREVTHARIGNLLYDLRETLNDLIKIRLNPVGYPLVQDEEGELWAIKNSLDWLLSDIRESRPKFKVISNG